MPDMCTRCRNRIAMGVAEAIAGALAKDGMHIGNITDSYQIGWADFGRGIVSFRFDLADEDDHESLRAGEASAPQQGEVADD